MILITLVGQAVSYDISRSQKGTFDQIVSDGLKCHFSEGRSRYLVRVTNILERTNNYVRIFS